MRGNIGEIWHYLGKTSGIILEKWDFFFFILRSYFDVRQEGHYILCGVSG